MKAARITSTLLTAAVLILGLTAGAYAYHGGGVAECTGCHQMHKVNASHPYLLKGRDNSSTCLGCHESTTATGPSSYRVSTPVANMPAGTAPLQRTPGGDFGWLKKTYTWTTTRGTFTEQGYTHGHSIIATDFSYDVDGTNATAPGGTMSSSRLACTSCHDPHGKYRRLSDGSIVTSGAPIIASGSYNSSPDPGANQAVGVYRLLGGIGYQSSGAPLFTQNPPTAVAPSTYNQTEATNQVRVAYGRGMSLWCSQCHPDMHNNTVPAGQINHPTDQNLGTAVRTIYNNYVNTSNTTGGNQGTSYLSLVPYSDNITSYATLKGLARRDAATYAGPNASEQVQCLSCHRAHASGWPHMLRWNMEGEFMTLESGGSPVWPGTDTTAGSFARGRTGAETQAAYYDRPASVFGAYQRVLCNKCHAKD